VRLGHLRLGITLRRGFIRRPREKLRVDTQLVEKTLIKSRGHAGSRNLKLNIRIKIDLIRSRSDQQIAEPASLKHRDDLFTRAAQGKKRFHQFLAAGISQGMLAEANHDQFKRRLPRGAIEREEARGKAGGVLRAQENIALPCLLAYGGVYDDLSPGSLARKKIAMIVIAKGN